VLEAAGDNAYWIQKLPAIQTVSTKIGYMHKELAMRMEKLLSTIVIHKRVDTLDSRLTQMEGELINNPLETNLGLFSFRKYTIAPDDAAFAFEKINDMWNEPIQARMDSEEETSDAEETEVQAEPEQTPPMEEHADQPRTTTETNRTETSSTKQKEKRNHGNSEQAHPRQRNRTEHTRQKNQTKQHQDDERISHHSMDGHTKIKRQNILHPATRNK
jgi:hypothetical protein